MIIKLSEVVAYLTHVKELQRNPMIPILLNLITQLPDVSYDAPVPEADLSRIWRYAKTFGVAKADPPMPDPVQPMGAVQVASIMRPSPDIAPVTQLPSDTAAPPPEKPKRRGPPGGHGDPPPDYRGVNINNPASAIPSTDPSTEQCRRNTQLRQAEERTLLERQNLGEVRPGEDDRPAWLKNLRYQ